MRSLFEKRLGRVLLAAGLLTAVLAIPALATPDDGTGHTVTICHVTNSEFNEFTVITVDRAAFDGLESNDHRRHVNKFGTRDHLYLEGPCLSANTTTTAPPTTDPPE